MYELYQAGAADAGSFQHARFCLQGELLHDGSVMLVADNVCKVVLQWSACSACQVVSTRICAYTYSIIASVLQAVSNPNAASSDL